ncbi:hypothetical protein A6F68_02761 [Tsuneonella dongtanensis]|uniref:Uncharacterized protein n=1 Tax=Tsuneonella dongtanensis TaxID=692370 RepID=A0A1B2AGK3_9SPHN|nr:hypothetical protein [Tsuneonella dongtanensis]ANY21251.1 hypothetical protein A6F68_02761 [Tsuneonella dongtanensis]
MKATPLFLGACVLASIAGAVGGATTNTTPIQNGGIGMDMLPQQTIAFDPADSGQPQAALPDQYAIVTPAGRFEVGELSTRGLYAQQRFAWREAAYSPPAEPLFEEEHSPSANPEMAVIDAEPIEAPVEPLDVSAPAAVGHSRTIDVAAALTEQG